MYAILNMIKDHINQFIGVMDSVDLFPNVSYFKLVVAFMILGIITSLFWKGGKT